MAQPQTINQIKDQLRAMGVKGYSGKNKAELLQMLANPNAFKAAGTPGRRKSEGPTIKSLREELKGLGAKGYSGKSKAELMALVAKYRGGRPPSPVRPVGRPPSPVRASPLSPETSFSCPCTNASPVASSFHSTRRCPHHTTTVSTSDGSESYPAYSRSEPSSCCSSNTGETPIPSCCCSTSDDEGDGTS